jgi:hypothetical protein
VGVADVGAICHLFGWRRTGVLFRQLAGHIAGRKAKARSEPDLGTASMAALQDYGDQHETSYEPLTAQLKTMLIWQERTTL